MSTAVHLPSRRELEALLLDARDFNSRVNVTGALLLNDVTFFQYFEGAETAALEVYERIRSSNLHYGIVELLRGPIDVRHFDKWHMGFAQAPNGMLLRLSQSAWCNYAEATRKNLRPLGIDLLLDFWWRANGDSDI